MQALLLTVHVIGRSANYFSDRMDFFIKNREIMRFAGFFELLEHIYFGLFLKYFTQIIKFYRYVLEVIEKAEFSDFIFLRVFC
jgi:hypothetical protein